MSTKLFLLFLCAAVGTFCGYMILLSYKKNYSYLDGVCGMINALKQNLSYKKDSVPVVLGGLKVESSQLQKNIREYIGFTDGQSDGRVISRGFLPQSTYDGVNDLFEAIGGSDESSQNARLDALSLRFEKLRAEAERKYKSMGAVAVKLGFLIGLGIGILVL
ncbi:MAG: hypothetical protein K2M47_04200 [Clostridiales bacterium]|nr:hypothetical protein [Clostridiales bacterium]